MDVYKLRGDMGRWKGRGERVGAEGEGRERERETDMDRERNINTDRVDGGCDNSVSIGMVWRVSLGYPPLRGNSPRDPTVTFNRPYLSRKVSRRQ